MRSVVLWAFFAVFFLLSQAQAECESADINNSGVVDLGDLQVFLANFGTSTPQCPDCDLNRDSHIDGRDLSLLLSCWGKTIVPELQPGSGFLGSTPEPPASCNHSSICRARAIARWDMVANSEMNSLQNIGVVAFHASGIDRVEFSIDGGPWVASRVPSHNPQTGVYEHWVRIATSALTGVEHEVRAMIFPKQGTPRLLSPLILRKPSLSTAQREVFLSPSGNDSNAGTAAAPLATLQRAVQILNSRNALHDGIVTLLPGSYSHRNCFSLPGSPGGWLTIRSSTNNPDDVRFAAGSGGFPGKNVHLKGISIERVGLGICDYLANVWLEGVRLTGLGQGVRFDFYYASNLNEIYATGGTEVRDSLNGIIGATLQRDVHLQNIGSDAFSSSKMVINSTAINVDSPNSEFHPDLYQLHGSARVENVILYGVRLLNSDTQGIFVRNVGELLDAAFVNLIIDRLPTSQGLSQFIGTDLNHVLLWGITSNQPFNFADDELIPGVQGSAVNVSVVGNVFPTLTANGPYVSLLDGEFRHNHFRLNAPALPSSSDTSVGNSGLFMNESLGDYRPAAGSPLARRIPIARIDVDIDGMTRQYPAAIGADE